MSDDDPYCLHLNNNHRDNNNDDNSAPASDDDSNTASVGSSNRLSDDSGIEDWSDDMTVQAELQQPLRSEDKHNNSPLAELLNTSISPIKDEASLIPSSECIFPMLPDMYPLHDVVKIHDTKQDVLSDDAVPGVCGLYNLGNTCFMNAALQCLFATPSLKDLLKDGNTLRSNGGIEHVEDSENVLLLAERFQELFQKVMTGKYSVVRPDQFHNSVARLHPTLGDYKQHDSQEFLSFLLNTLHELLNQGRGRHRNNIVQNNGSSSSSDFSESSVSMKRLKMDNEVQMEPDAGVDCEEHVSKSEAAWRTYTADNQSQIIESFHGQFQSVITCDKCSFVSTTYEPFMSLSLPIPHAMEKQFIITWIPSLKLSALPGMTSARKYCVTVSKSATCADLKSAFLSLLRKTDDQLHTDQMVLVEAKQSASVSVLDDRTLISYISKEKDIYAIEVVQGCDKQSSLTSEMFVDEVVNGNGNHKMADIQMDGGMSFEDDQKTNSVEGAATWHSCGICLEEIFDEELKVHLVCGGLLCDPCLTNMIEVSEPPSYNMSPVHRG